MQLSVIQGNAIKQNVNCELTYVDHDMTYIVVKSMRFHSRIWRRHHVEIPALYISAGRSITTSPLSRLQEHLRDLMTSKPKPIIYDFLAGEIQSRNAGVERRAYRQTYLQRRSRAGFETYIIPSSVPSNRCKPGRLEMAPNL